MEGGMPRTLLILFGDVPVEDVPFKVTYSCNIKPLVSEKKIFYTCSLKIKVQNRKSMMVQNTV